MSPSGPAATTSSDGVIANWPMRGYCGRQLVVLRVVTRSGPSGTAAGMAVLSRLGSAPLASDEPGVGIKVADEEAGDRGPPSASGPESSDSVRSMGAELGDRRNWCGFPSLNNSCGWVWDYTVRFNIASDRLYFSQVLQATTRSKKPKRTLQPTLQWRRHIS